MLLFSHLETGPLAWNHTHKTALHGRHLPCRTKAKHQSTQPWDSLLHSLHRHQEPLVYMEGYTRKLKEIRQSYLLSSETKVLPFLLYLIISYLRYKYNEASLHSTGMENN